MGDDIMKSATNLARNLGAKALVVMSKSGASVLRASRQRPGLPILAVTPDAGVARALALQKNVYPVVMDPLKYGESVYRYVAEEARIKNLVDSEEDSLFARRVCHLAILLMSS